MRMRVVNNCVSGGCASEGVCIRGGFVLNVALFSSSMSVVLAPLPIMHHHNSRTSTKKNVRACENIQSENQSDQPGSDFITSALLFFHYCCFKYQTLIIRKFNKEFLKWSDCFCEGCYFLLCMKMLFNVTS